jgi:ribosomal subunit interface protein
MEITVYGKHTQIGVSLDEHIKVHLKDVVKKYFKDALNAHVTIEKEGHLFKSEIIINEGTGTGVLIKSNGQEYDSYRSFNIANEKIEKQLRRYKNRIKNHKHPKLDPIEVLSGTKYVISPFEEEEVTEHEKSPIIIAEKPTSIESLSVKDAVMRMDLLNLPALVFVNEGTNNLNVIYYRKDENISWIDMEIPVK